MPTVEQIFALYADQIADDFRVIIRERLFTANPHITVGKWFESHIQFCMQKKVYAFEINMRNRWIQFDVE
jgi:hypothetical protein